MVEHDAKTLRMPELEGARHSFVDAGGLRMHLAEMGPEHAPAVLLLHGWPQHWWEWRHLMPALATDFRVLAPDLRGLGWTEAPPTGYLKKQLAADVLRLLDALEIDRVDLVGHDWGGFIGFLLGIHTPERVKRFLALNIYPPFLPANPRTAFAMWRFWYQLVLASPLGDRAAAILGSDPARIAARWLGSDGWTEVERETFLGQFRDPARAHATMRYYRDFQLRELPAIALGRYGRSRLRVPTRILFGMEDQALNWRALEGADRLAASLSVEFVPGCSHFIADERPDLVLSRARELFEAA